MALENDPVKWLTTYRDKVVIGRALEPSDMSEDKDVEASWT